MMSGGACTVIVLVTQIRADVHVSCNCFSFRSIVMGSKLRWLLIVPNDMRILMFQSQIGSNHFTSSFNLLDRKQKLNHKTKSHIVAGQMREMLNVCGFGCVYDNDMLTIFMDDECYDPELKLENVLLIKSEQQTNQAEKLTNEPSEHKDYLWSEISCCVVSCFSTIIVVHLSVNQVNEYPFVRSVIFIYMLFRSLYFSHLLHLSIQLCYYCHCLA